MLKELDSLVKCDREVKVAKDDLDAAMAPHDLKISLLRKIMGKIQEEIRMDPAVQQAVENLTTLETMYVNVEAWAKQAVIDYWEEFGFSTGKKSVVMEGCRLRIRETINRQIVDSGKMVLAAREDGVYAKVIQELRPIVNRASFNSWVDLKAPSGVEVAHAVTATVIILEED